MRYQQIILDVDDTLLDTEATVHDSLVQLFKSHGWEISDEFEKEFHAYNQGLWRRLEKGELTLNQLYAIMFPDIIKKYCEVEVDGMETADEFHSYFHTGHKLLPGVKDTLRYAKRLGYSLAVLSNGEQFCQEHRLELAGIRHYFDLVVTSQEAGVQKPNAEIFDYFFARSGYSPNQTVFFGDGLSSDIMGAENYGFASIWFNHRHRQKTLPVHPLFEVDNYAQFQRILKKDFAPTALR